MVEDQDDVAHPGPPPKTPTFEVPVYAERREPLGWVLVFGLISFLVLAQAISWFMPVTDAAPVAKYDRELESALYLRYDSFLSLSSKSAKQSDGDDALAKLEKKVRPWVDKDARLARMSAAIQYERTSKVEAALLTRLSKSSLLLDQTTAKTYARAGLSPAEARRLAAAIPATDTTSKLTRLHALRRAKDSTEAAAIVGSPKWPWRVPILLGYAGIALFGIGVWIYYFSRRSAGTINPVGGPQSRIGLLDADRNALRMAMCIFAMVAIPLTITGLFTSIWRSATGNVQDAGVGTMVGSLASALLLPFVISLPAFQKRLQLREVIGTTSTPGRLVGFGVLGYAANVPIMVVLSIIGMSLTKFLPEPSHPATDSLMANPTVATVLSIFVLACVIAPFTEELTFRGLLFPAVARVRGSVISGVVLSSLAFALMHPQGLPLVPALMSVGAMGAILAHHTGSLVPSMVMHALNNFVTLLLALFVF